MKLIFDIDVFIETYRDLESHDGHMTEPEAINLFLDNIHDPDYSSWITAIKLHKDMTLDDHVLQFRERADDINISRTSKRKLKQHIRRLSSKRTKTDSDTSDDDATTAHFRTRRQNKSTASIRTRRTTPLEITPRPSGLLSLGRQEWHDVCTEEDRILIQEYNAKVKHNEPTDTMQIPSTLHLVRPRRTPNTKHPPQDIEESTQPVSESSNSSSSSDDPSSRKVKTPVTRKKIRFNLTDTKAKVTEG